MRKNVKFFYARHDGYRGSNGIAPLILNLDTRWRCVVYFTRWPLYPRGRTTYPLNRGLGGPQKQPGSFAEEKNLFFSYGVSNPTPSSPCCIHYADWTTPASWSLLTWKISTDCLANFARYKFVLWMKCSFFGRNNSSKFANGQNLLKISVVWTCIIVY